MMLLFMQEMLKTFMPIQVFHVLGLNIFVLHFLMNWSEKKDGKFIFKKQNISPQIFNIILGNVKLISVIKILIVYLKIYSKYLVILTRFIYCENIFLYFFFKSFKAIVWTDHNDKTAAWEFVHNITKRQKIKYH